MLIRCLTQRLSELGKRWYSLVCIISNTLELLCGEAKDWDTLQFHPNLYSPKRPRDNSPCENESLGNVSKNPLMPRMVVDA